jgi:cysteine desulfurase
LRLTYLPVDGHGRVEPADLRAAISSDTALVSVMVGNAEHILTTVTTPELR